jgi:hypothetical protein
MFLWPFIVIILITVVVGVAARILNNLQSLNEMNAMKNKPSRQGNEGGGKVRQQKSEMDRFLAEIDRLRKKSAESPPPPPNKPAPVAPVVQPAKKPERTERRPKRVLAEVVDFRPDMGFATSPPATVDPTPTALKAGDIPIATVVTPPSGTGAPATKVTRIAGRARPLPKTPFARNITNLLNSGQGLAMAIVLQEILGPPRSKRGG